MLQNMESTGPSLFKLVPTTGHYPMPVTTPHNLHLAAVSMYQN